MKSVDDSYAIIRIAAAALVALIVIFVIATLVLT